MGVSSTLAMLPDVTCTAADLLERNARERDSAEEKSENKNTDEEKRRSD
jgi:hypothetical protein